MLRLTLYASLLGVEDEQQVEDMLGVEENGGMCLYSLNHVHSLYFHVVARGAGSEDLLDDTGLFSSWCDLKTLGCHEPYLSCYFNWWKC